MSSSWKKVKNGRLSQLLSDRISERRRKGADSPLVVQTGFPASIVDLFVKNKDKLKNPLMKKQRRNDPGKCSEINSSEDDCGYGVSDASSPPPPLPPSLSASPLNRFSGDVVVVEDGSGGETECVGRNLVSAAVLRLFWVVVLALGTKKFVVGITFSAFGLLFLEYLVKQEWIRIPCTKSKEVISLMVRKVMGFRRIRKGSQEESNSGSNAVIEIQEEQGKMMGDNSSRIGVEETGIEHNEILCEKEKEGDCKGEVEGLYIKDIIKAEAGEEIRKRKSRKAKIRLKMREFLPERLRKKRSKDVDVGVGNIEEEEDQRESSSLSSMSRDVDELVELSSNHNEEETITQPIEHHSSSSYVSLVLVVLLGLVVGGRVFALVLTLSWCLLLKSGSAMGRRLINASILRRSSATKYSLYFNSFDVVAM